MAGNGYTIQQQLLSNKHLKERNDTITSETEAFYHLHCKHRIESDQLAFDKVTDTEKRRLVTTQQSKEAGELRQRNSESRALIRERHVQEESALQQKLSESKTARQQPFTKTSFDCT